MGKDFGRSAGLVSAACAAFVAALTFFGAGSVWVPEAQAVALHTLTPAGCISDPNVPITPTPCDSHALGLFGASDVAVSPDGASVYVAAQSYDTIVRFDRSTGGSLNPAGCISDTNTKGAADCGVPNKQEGLDGARDVAVSPDGGSVYVASGNDDAIVRFKRDPDGTLHPAGCISDPESSTDCGGATQQGLDAAFADAVSPDGRSVYVAGTADDSIVRFNRDPNGTLHPAGCIADLESSTDCGVGVPKVQGLHGARDLAVSPDGGSVYVASQSDDTIVRFNRDTDGKLTPAGCISDLTSSTDCGGPNKQEGLDGAYGVTVSPDGSTVYVVSGGNDNAIVRFNRDPDGTLHPAGCIADPESSTDCGGATQQGLTGAGNVAVSRDGTSVYVGSYGVKVMGNSAIVQFDRAPDGSLANGGCISDEGDPAGCSAATQQGLWGARGVAVSPDDGSVYVAALEDNAIVRFKREVPPVVNIVPPESQTVFQGPAAATTTTTKLLALLSKHRLSGRSGRRLAVRFSTSGAGKAKLVVKRGRRTLIRKTKSADRAGVHRLMLRLARKHKPLPPGKYALQLTVSGADGQVALDSARLRVRR